MKLALVFIWLIWMMAFSVSGQDTLFYRQVEEVDSSAAIRTIAQYAGDSMVLRWAPSDAATWLKLNEEGYIVRRHEVSKDGLPLRDTKTEFAVQPWTYAQFEKEKNTTNNYVLVAAQVLYGESEAAALPGLQLYAHQSELANRFGFGLMAADLDPAAATALGWRYTDHDVVQDRLYVYEVLAKDTALHVRPGPILIATKQMLTPVPVLTEVREEEGHVVVMWSRAGHEEYFSAYQIEISENGKDFRKSSDIPFVGGESKEYPGEYFGYRFAVENYKPIHFRIKGITPFGNMSLPSNVIRAQGRDKTPTSVPDQVDIHCDQISGLTSLRWKDPKEKDFSAIEIWRSSRFDGPFEMPEKGVIRKGREYFEEMLPDTRLIWYYKLAAVDTAGNTQFSRVYQAAFRDTIAPATPVMIKGMVDSAGVVRLTWTPNQERDLAGYQVYMANQADHIFTNMTPRPVQNASWSDTISLHTFTEEIFYRVAAVDFHAHVSEWSEPVKLIRPDTLAPMPPSFTGYRVEKDHILLRVSPGKSKDIVQHQLQRRKNNDAHWKQLTSFDITKGLYQDYDVVPGDVYEYQLSSVDDAGLICKNPAEIRITCVDRSRPEAPALISCVQEQSSIRLQWEQPEQRTQHILIYRSVNGGHFTTVATLTDALSYTDQHILKGNTYSYKIKTTWQDGQRSAFSEVAMPVVK